MSSAHNISGQAYSLTVMTPIVNGRETQLARYLDGLQSRDQSPLAGVRGTHFARWVIIDDVIYEGSDEGDREHLKHARLLFTSNFDGELDPYLEALRTGLSDSADTIWGNCIGYPGSGEPRAFADYMRHHQLDSSLFFSAYGDRTVEEVKRSLALRTKFIAFALTAQGLPASELQAAFLQEFPLVTALDLDRIQGLVVRGYRLKLARYIFLRIDDPAAAGAWIAEIAGEVLTAAPWSEKPASGLNVAFSYAGLAALALPTQTLASFPEEFRGGMAARASLLGDDDLSAPANWEAPFGAPQVHVLVMIAAAHEEALSAHDQRIRASIERSGGLTVIYEDLGSFMPDYREHFGYADGFAQPDIEGAGLPSQPGDGAPLSGGHWRPLRAGEFILGYPDEENLLPDAPTPDQLATNGSFLVYRKLHQDVAAFRAQLAQAAQLYPGGEELLAAKIVGRWRDGTPIDLSPEHPDAAIVADGDRNNAFSYTTDSDGLRCPVGAHVRRANPRDSLPFEGKLVNRHRLIRRGIPYGDPLPEGAGDDGKDRGVIFMCLQASIARQFEFIQGQWLNGGNAFTLGEDQDVLLGAQDTDGPHKMTVPGNPPFFLGPLQRVVTVKGGEYFFVPGINGLQFLASAAASGAE